MPLLGIPFDLRGKNSQANFLSSNWKGGKMQEDEKQERRGRKLGAKCMFQRLNRLIRKSYRSCCIRNTIWIRLIFVTPFPWDKTTFSWVWIRYLGIKHNANFACNLNFCLLTIIAFFSCQANYFLSAEKKKLEIKYVSLPETSGRSRFINYIIIFLENTFCLWKFNE